MVTSLKAGSPYSHLSRHRQDSLRSRVRRCSSKGCASTEDPSKLRPRLAWALRDLAAGLPGGFRRALPPPGLVGQRLGRAVGAGAPADALRLRTVTAGAVSGGAVGERE